MIPSISFRPEKEKRLAQGYLWAFRNELDFKEKDYAPGSLVTVKSAKGRPLGTGFINSQANLCFRMLATPIESRHCADEAGALELIRARLALALAWREECLPKTEAKRLVFSEGDGLSGLIVDQYGDVLVVQFGSLGLDSRRDAIIEELKRLTRCKAIVERSEGASRLKEGLEPRTGLAWSEGSLNESVLLKHPVTDGRLKFELNLMSGQKTGFFLDQRDTRALVEKLAKGRACLDAFCHTGALSLAMAKGGAKSVLGIDESGAAITAARRNAEINKLKCEFEETDAFAALRAMDKKGERFDLVLLDPPAMAKDKAAVGDALRGYKELNLRALRLLPPGGLLVSCSCTQAVDEESFSRAIQSAAVDASARIQEIYRLGQPEDHPRHPAMPETRYLKVLVFRKL